MKSAKTQAEIEDVKARGIRVQEWSRRYDEDPVFRAEEDRKAEEGAAKLKPRNLGLKGSMWADGGSIDTADKDVAPAPVAKVIPKSQPAAVSTPEKTSLHASTSVYTPSPSQPAPAQMDGNISPPLPSRPKQIGILGSRWNPENVATEVTAVAPAQPVVPAQINGNRASPLSSPPKQLGILGSKWNPANNLFSQPNTKAEAAPVAEQKRTPRKRSPRKRGSADLKKQTHAAEQNIPQALAMEFNTAADATGSPRKRAPRKRSPRKRASAMNSKTPISAVEYGAFVAQANRRVGNSESRSVTGGVPKQADREGMPVLLNINPTTVTFPGKENDNSLIQAQTSLRQNDIRPTPEGKKSDETVTKEGVRATQGVDAAEELQAFDGSWNHAPWDWETRGGFDNSYIPSYIKEWSKSLPISAEVVDTSVPEYLMGNHLAGEKALAKPAVSVPNSLAGENENEDKRVTQTAVIESELFTKALNTLLTENTQMAHANAMRRSELAGQEIEPNLFAPTIEMYLRPATTKDASGIARLYNHYVNNSIIPEDQDDVDGMDISFLLHGCETNKLPFIVAVKGNCPPSIDAQGRELKKIVMPQFENIIGFAFAQVQSFGFAMANSFNGRSRTNANLHLYVQHDLQSKGIGRNLLDRLLVSMNPAYSFHNAASWINPGQDTGYLSPTTDRWQQLFFQLPVDGDDNAEFLRTREFLAKFSFFDSPESRLTGAGRTSKKYGPARFVDIAIFKGTCLHAAIFGPFN